MCTARAGWADPALVSGWPNAPSLSDRLFSQGPMKLSRPICDQSALGTTGMQVTRDRLDPLVPSVDGSLFKKVMLVELELAVEVNLECLPHLGGAHLRVRRSKHVGSVDHCESSCGACNSPIVEALTGGETGLAAERNQRFLEAAVLDQVGGRRPGICRAAWPAVGIGAACARRSSASCAESAGTLTDVPRYQEC
jgi:hypothetical protein